MELYKHNQEAYEMVMTAFRSKRKAAVIHATGTGKSIIGGAVANHFNKVLIVAPNKYVLAQASKASERAECRTYSWLSLQKSMPVGYDLIWFDEFHRMGAETWSAGCQRLIDANPNAKILGTTATSERSLEKRDMADEWFKDSVVSVMSLTDAWVRNVLRVPVYVIGVVSMDNTQNDYKHKICSSRRADANTKKLATTMLDKEILNWNKANGVPRILRKYIDHEVERIVVFAQSIERLEESRKILPQWFAQAGIKVAGIYAAHSEMGTEADRQIDAFETNNNEGVKILLSVDMLNEGVHINRVDAVIMFRATISKNIYMQQIGRCFAVGQKHQPIILDLADNLSKACGYEGIYDAKERYEKAQRENTGNGGNEEVTDTFWVIDTLKETREVLSQIDNMLVNKRTWDEIQEYIAEFYAKNGRLPNTKDERSVYAYMNKCRKRDYMERFPERIAFLQSLGWQAEVENERIGFKEAYNSVRDYKERYGELPNKEHKMLRKLKESLGHNKLKDHQVALLSELGITKKSMNDIFQRKYNEIKSVYDAHGSLESLKRKDRVWIFYQQEHRERLNKEQCEMLDAIGAFDLKKIEYNIRYHKV